MNMKGLWLAFIFWAASALVVIGIAGAQIGRIGGQQDVRQQSFENIEIRAASGALTAAETTTAVTDTGHFNTAVIFFDITTMTTADADDVVDFYLQTSYDAGTTWHDLENLHFDIADTGTTPERLIVLGPMIGVDETDTAITPSDGAITDDTKANLPHGDRLRVKTLVEGATAPTYAYSVRAFFR